MSVPAFGRHAALLMAVMGMAIGASALAPIAQGSAAHLMVDARSFFGIPNSLDVLSNAPFAAVGLVGLAVTFGRRIPSPFNDPWERWPYAVLFAGVGLVAFGSTYYHLAPDNARLLWDRLPMSIAFVALLTALIAERIGVGLGRRLFMPLLAAGAGSVLYWYWSEMHGAGDLRPYILVQFGSLVLIGLMLALYPARHQGTGYLVAGLGAYAVAKVFEAADERIFTLSGILSGHTLKHLAAAAGVACLVEMLRVRGRLARARRFIGPPPDAPALRSHDAVSGDRSEALPLSPV